MIKNNFLSLCGHIIFGLILFIVFYIIFGPIDVYPNESTIVIYRIIFFILLLGITLFYFLFGYYKLQVRKSTIKNFLSTISIIVFPFFIAIIFIILTPKNLIKNLITFYQVFNTSVDPFMPLFDGFNSKYNIYNTSFSYLLELFILSILPSIFLWLGLEKRKRNDLKKDGIIK